MRVFGLVSTVIVAVVVVTAVAVASANLARLESAIVPGQLSLLRGEAALLTADLRSTLVAGKDDLLALRAAEETAMVALIRRGGNGSELARHFRAIMEAKPVYRQIRLLDDAGMERIRTERNDPTDPVRRASDSQLQPKAHRPYYREVIGMQPGEIHVSPIDLNQEFGEVETPYVPTVRFATPVHDAEGTVAGVLVSNVDLRPAFDALRTGARAEADVYVVDADGDFLVHPDTALEFGFDLGERHVLSEEFPALTQPPAGDPIVRESVAGVRTVLASAPVELPDVPRLVVVLAAPYSDLLAPFAAVRRSTALATFGVVFVAVLVSLLVARRLTRPLARMTAAVERFPSRNLSGMPVHDGTEIGVLARAFERMAADVGERTTALQHEIERRRETESEMERLIALQRLYAAVFASTRDAVIIVGLDRRITGWNPAAEMLFGYTHAEAVGQLIDIIVPARLRDEEYRSLERVRAGEGISNHETERQRRDGSQVMVSLSIAPVRASNGEAASQNGILGAATILRDITEQKQLEARQIAADRMASVGVLAAGVAHEVNNPLMALLANLELALAALESGTHAGTEDLRGQLLDAGNAARMVRDIVRDLNLLSRDEGEVRRPTDVHAVLESAIRISLSDISLRARLVRDLDPVPAVLANESRLGQVFVNLLVNAFQAIPEGDPDRHRITVSTRSAGDMVSISVTDTGMGIPPDVQSRIFTPFFTTKPVGEGTGLGLSICRSIIDRFGGSLTLSSQVGRGSTFVVYLMATSEAPVVRPSRPTRAVSGRRGRVLLVDDDPMILRVLHRILSSRHDVTLASSAHDALDRIADAATPFDLILCDLMMPGMTGIDLYERLSEGEVGPSVPFLFLTGGVFTDKARAFLDVTPVDCIEKPVEADALRRLVAAHMA